MSFNSIISEVESIAPNIASALSLPFIQGIVLKMLSHVLGVPVNDIAAMLGDLSNNPALQSLLQGLEAELAELKL